MLEWTDMLKKPDKAMHEHLKNTVFSITVHFPCSTFLLFTMRWRTSWHRLKGKFEQYYLR